MIWQAVHPLGVPGAGAPGCPVPPHHGGEGHQQERGQWFEFLKLIDFSSNGITSYKDYKMKINPNYQNDLLGFPSNLLDNVYVIKNESASDHV